MKKFILITGSTDGIGLVSAKKFAALGKNIIIHGRNPEKLDNTKRVLLSINASIEIKTVVSDFEDLSRTKTAFLEIADIPVNTLINNAGTFSSVKKQTKDGFETTYQVNHLAHFMITHILLDTLIRNASSKIIVVASMAHSNDMDFDMLRRRDFTSGYDAYEKSKLCNILFAFKMARMLKSENVSVNCIHPGVINTKLLVDNWGACGNSVENGYKMIMFAYDLPQNISGEYLKDFRIGKAADKAYDKHYQDTCYDISHEHLKNFMELK